MAKIKRLINFGLPVTACNMRCSYCYVSQMGWNDGELGTLDYSPEHIQRCLTKERLGGVCHISMCGSGETLLPPYTVDLVKRMLENGHFVSVVTNGTITKRIKELCDFPEEHKERLFFKFSLHYLELKRLKMLDVFFENVRYVKEHGCAYTLELAASDDYIPYIDEIKKICKENVGAYCHVVELRKQNDSEAYSRLTEQTLAEHQKIWGTFDSELFDFQQEHWDVKRCEFCYAGDWITQLDARTGWLVPCFIGGSTIQNIFENPDEPIRFVGIGGNCPWPHCYSAYVLLTSGAVPALEIPTYADLRNRFCDEGTGWLTPAVKEFFSSKFIEANDEYSDDKKIFINALMALEYKNRTRAYEPEKTGKIVEKALEAKGIDTVGIWGASIYTDWLFDLLQHSSIKVKYIVDDSLSEKEQHYGGLFGRQIKTAVFGKNDKLPKVDAMVITDCVHFNGIKQQIPPVYKKLLVLTELAD